MLAKHTFKKALFGTSQNGSSRVVVTGLGIVSPIGVGKEENWKNILSGKSGIVSVKGDKEFEGLKSQIGGKLPDHFNVDEHKMSFGDARVFSLANAVTKEALNDANINIKGLTADERDRTGINIANQFGVLENYMKPNNKLRLLMTMNHMVSALLAMEHQITGHLSTPSVASSSSAIAIGEAYRLIKHGYQDRMITGGVDYNLNRHFFEGMELFGANCNKYNNDPSKASRPFDVKRQGPVMSDGGAVLVLENLEMAKKRGATIYCEIVGFQQNTDAFHILRPTDNGIGLFKAIQDALIQASLTPSDVDSINSHATSTPAGDLSEAMCLKRLLGNKETFSKFQSFQEWCPNEQANIQNPEIEVQQLKRAVITAPKGHIGHTFCAAGAIESVFGILSIKNQIIPQILNLEEPLDKDLTFALQNIEKKVDVVVKTALAFGGINSAIVYKAFRQSPKL